ncbi:MAG: hypothetical protein GY757_35090 [bacterium]|nr:hypothetical protein [bacterium]
MIATGAGNCMDLAALTYCLCRDYYSPQETIEFIENETHGHGYVKVYGDTGPEIVVDAWPINAQAVLKLDHFCVGGKELKHKTNRGKKTGDYGENGEQTKNAKIQRRAGSFINSIVVYGQQCGNKYTNNFSSRYGTTIKYKAIVKMK